MDPLTYVETHPPRCLDGVNARLSPRPKTVFINPDDILTVFELRCRCGGGLLIVHGYDWTNPDYNNQRVFLSPLVLECSTCGRKVELLDTDEHGHVAEIGEIVATCRAEGEPSRFECPDCNHQPLHVRSRFDYLDDLFEDDFTDSTPPIQDQFTWFMLSGTCPQCAKEFEITDFKCY